MQEKQNKIFNLPSKDLPIKPLTKKALHEIIRERVSLIDQEFNEGFKFLENYPKSVTFFGSTRLEETSEYYAQARSIAGRISTELGYSIISGGGPGIMEAGNRGAFENGGTSLGLTIELPNGQARNPYIDKYIDFYYFFIRKVCLSFSAEAYIFFPGGFGTFDEMFEILTLVQTHKIENIPIILVGSNFWKNIEETLKKEMLSRNLIDADDLKLYTITDDEDEIIDIIRKAPIRESVEFKGEGLLKKHQSDTEKGHAENKLAKKDCVPCEGNTPPMNHTESEELLSHTNQWILIEDEKIEKTLHLKNFKEVMTFVNKIAHLAEEQGHHPDIDIFDFNKVKITLTTHAIKGLSENDFIMASKIDEILR